MELNVKADWMPCKYEKREPILKCINLSDFGKNGCVCVCFCLRVSIHRMLFLVWFNRAIWFVPFVAIFCFIDNQNIYLAIIHRSIEMERANVIREKARMRRKKMAFEPNTPERTNKRRYFAVACQFKMGIRNGKVLT